MIDPEVKSRLDDIDSAIDELFALFGRLSPRQATLGPAYLHDPGPKICECVGGLMVVRDAQSMSGAWQTDATGG
jgi:hypothetical protein